MYWCSVAPNLLVLVILGHAPEKCLAPLRTYAMIAWLPYTTGYITPSLPPLGRPSKLDCDNQEGVSANTERYVFGKLSARCFQRCPIWHWHCSRCCGDIEHGKSFEGGVWHTPSHTVTVTFSYIPVLKTYELQYITWYVLYKPWL